MAGAGRPGHSSRQSAFWPGQAFPCPSRRDWIGRASRIRIGVLRKIPFPRQQPLFGGQIEARPHAVLRSAPLRCANAFLLELPQSGSPWGDGLPKGDRPESNQFTGSLADPFGCRVDATARMGRAFSRSRSGRLRADHGARQYEPAGKGPDRDYRQFHATWRHSMPPFGTGEITSPKVELALCDVRAFNRRGRSPVRPLDRRRYQCHQPVGQKRFRTVQGQGALRRMSQWPIVHRRLLSRYWRCER